MCIQYTHQKSWKLDEGIMLIFASEKNRLLLLSKGVYEIWYYSPNIVVTRDWVTYVCHLAFLQRLTLIPEWISIHMPGKVWNEMTYSLLNFNGYRWCLEMDK